MIEIELFRKNYQVIPPPLGKKITAICPSPEEADRFRSLQGESGNVQAITISSFLKNNLRKLEKENSFLEKNDLIFHLGVIWKKYFKSRSEDSFSKAYTLFSDLRSYVLNFEILEDVRDEFDPILYEALYYFYFYLEETKLLDEHRSYALIGENAHLLNFEAECFIIWGFHQMTTIQVEMLRSLSEFVDIKIPFPFIVFQETSHFDWIKWISDFSKIKILEESENHKEIINDLVFFGKSEILKKINLYTQKQNSFDIFLLQKDNKPEQMMELPFPDSFFKISIDVFQYQYKRVFDKVRKWCFYAQRNIILKNDLLIKIDKELLKIKEKFKISQKGEFPKILKIWLDLKKEIERYCDLSVENQNISFFDISLLEKVGSLNAPRLSLINLLRSDLCSKVSDLHSFYIPLNNRKKLLIGTKSFSTFSLGSGVKYSDKVLALLSTLGPIQRKELENKLNREKILRILKYSSSVLFLENEIEKESTFWFDILNEIKTLKIINLDTKLNKNHLKKNYLSVQEKSSFEVREKHSATQLQSFLDCPRKYYWDYVEGKKKKFELKDKLENYHLGQIEHKVIERFFTEKIKGDEKLKGIISEEIRKLCDFSHIHLDDLSFYHYLEEVFCHSQNGINSLLLIQENCSVESFDFEVQLEEKEILGSIDCVIKTSQGIGIIDFKRSSYGVPTQKDLLEFQKIQLPFYLNHFSSHDEILFFGYLCLTDPEESFIIENRDFSLFGKKIKDFIYEDFIERYKKFESDLVLNLKKEVSFPPNPRDLDICSYCHFQTFCERG